MKNKVIAFFCIIAMFIPTYIAIAHYITAQNSTLDLRVVSKMQLLDLNGNVFTFERKSTVQSNNTAEDNMIDFFMQLNENSRLEESGLPDPLKDKDSFVVSYFSYDRETKFNYYFSSNPSEAYFTDNNGEAFRINEDDANNFLLSKYARCLFPSSAEPVLTLADNSTVEPLKLTWRYLTHLNQYIESVNINNTTTNIPIQTHSLVGGVLGLNFNVWPDSLYVTIVEHGKSIFADWYENLSSINLNENTTINITLDAVWYDDDNARGANGEASYQFYGEVKAQPSFYLEKTSIDPGEFVVLTGINVQNINDIKFSSEPSINFTPVFFVDDKDNRYVRALIPVAYDLPEIDESKDLNIAITISMYGNPQVLNLTVKAKTFKVRDYAIADSNIMARRTEDTIEAFKKALASTYSSKESKRYWDDDLFISALEGYTINKLAQGFGIHRRISGSAGTGERYRNPGIDYITNGGEKVLAVSSGRVIYEGEQILSGKIVVIDHGWGLKSTYCHMSIVSVKEGDIVSRGSIIGIVGATGFTRPDWGLHESISVFDVPVSPYPMWENPIPLKY